METGISVNEVSSSTASKYPTVSKEKLRLLNAAWAVIWPYPHRPTCQGWRTSTPSLTPLLFTSPYNRAPLPQLGQYRSRDTAPSATFFWKSIHRSWTWDKLELQNPSPPSLPRYTSTCSTLTSLFSHFWFFSLNFVFTALYPARRTVTIQSLFSNLQRAR